MKKQLIILFLLLPIITFSQTSQAGLWGTSSTQAHSHTNFSGRVFLEALWLAAVVGHIGHDGYQTIRQHPYKALTIALALVGITQYKRLCTMPKKETLQEMLARLVTAVKEPFTDEQDDLLREATFCRSALPKTPRGELLEDDDR